MIAADEVVGKLRSLSSDRSQRVLALIEDLAELQALEDKQDLEDARAARDEPGENVPLEQLAKELGVQPSDQNSILFTQGTHSRS